MYRNLSIISYQLSIRKCICQSVKGTQENRIVLKPSVFKKYIINKLLI